MLVCPSSCVAHNPAHEESRDQRVSGLVLEKIQLRCWVPNDSIGSVGSHVDSVVVELDWYSGICRTLAKTARQDRITQLTFLFHKALECHASIRACDGLFSSRASDLSDCLESLRSGVEVLFDPIRLESPETAIVVDFNTQTTEHAIEKICGTAGGQDDSNQCQHRLPGSTVEKARRSCVHNGSHALFKSAHTHRVATLCEDVHVDVDIVTMHCEETTWSGHRNRLLKACVIGGEAHDHVKVLLVEVWHFDLAIDMFRDHGATKIARIPECEIHIFQSVLYAVSVSVGHILELKHPPFVGLRLVSGGASGTS